MKRFWLDNFVWPWSWKMSKSSLTFVILMLMQLVPSSSTVDKKCEAHKLQPCDENEICVVVDNNGNGVCHCQPGFVLNNDTGKCEKSKPPPEPSGSHWGLGVGLALTFLFIFVVITLFVLHYKFGLLTGLCNRLPRINLFGTTGNSFSMMDNEDSDDVNPIV